MGSKRDRKAYQAAYYLAHKEKAKERARIWDKSNAERVKGNKAAYYKANTDKKKASAAAWYAANPERKRKALAAWKKANPEKKRIHDNDRRARKGNGADKLSKDLVPKLLVRQKGRCAICKKSIKRGYHLDHVIPLVRGGRNTDSNTQLTCCRCNLKKGAKGPIQFMQEQGFLL